MAEGKTLKEILLNNWMLKILAVIMGVISFYAIRQGAINFEVPYEVPVEVKVEKGVAILDQNPRTVEVTFRGSQEDVRQLSMRQIKIVIQPQSGEYAGAEEKIILKPENVEGVHGVRVAGIKPDQIQVILDREDEKKVPVAKPKSTGKPFTGTVEIEYEPKSVTLKGPRKRLQGVSILETEPVDVEGRLVSFAKNIAVLPPSDVPGLTISPPEIEARVNITTETATRSFTNIIVRALSSAGNIHNIQLDPSAVKVVIHGRKDLVNAISDQAISAFVDIRGVEKDANVVLPVNVYIKGGEALEVTVDPENIKVIISAVTGT